jgi:hypothetical protein
MLWIEVSVLSGEGSVEVVGRVEVDPGFGCVDLELASGCVVNNGRDRIGKVTILAKDEGMVEAADLGSLDIRGIQSVVEGFGDAEIEGAVGDRFGLPGRGLGILVIGKIRIGLNLHTMVADTAGFLSGKIKVGMYGRVDDRGGVGGSGKLVAKSVFRGEGDFDGEFQLAGISHFPVGTGVFKNQYLSVFTLTNVSLEELAGESFRSAVKMSFSVVQRQCVLLAVEAEGSICDPVGVTADDGPEVRIVFLHVIIDGIEPKGHIIRHSDTVGHFEFDQNSTVVEKPWPAGRIRFRACKLVWVVFPPVGQAFLRGSVLSFNATVGTCRKWTIPLSEPHVNGYANPEIQICKAKSPFSPFAAGPAIPTRVEGTARRKGRRKRQKWQ